MLTRLDATHREALAEILRLTPEFTPDEQEVALELIDRTLTTEDTYRFWVDAEGSDVRGYICYGPTPMTRGTFDLYWIAVHPAYKGKGVGRILVDAMENVLREEWEYLYKTPIGRPDFDTRRDMFPEISRFLFGQESVSYIHPIGLATTPPAS